jgi:hypothetical protein
MMALIVRLDLLDEHKAANILVEAVETLVDAPLSIEYSSDELIEVSRQAIVYREAIEAERVRTIIV